MNEKKFKISFYFPEELKGRLIDNSRRFGCENLSEYVAITFESLLRTGVDKSLVKDLQAGDGDEPLVPLFDKHEKYNDTSIKAKVVCHKGLYYPVAFSDKIRIFCPLEVAGTYGNKQPKSKSFNKDLIPLMTIPSADINAEQHEEIGVSNETLDIIERRLSATLKYIKEHGYEK